MNCLLSFVSAWEFLLRYTVVAGTIIMSIGVALCLMTKRIVIAIRKSDEIVKGDKLYSKLVFFGVALILIGMMVCVLPVGATFYRG